MRYLNLILAISLLMITISLPTQTVEVVQEPPVVVVQEPQMIDLGEFKITAYCPCSKCCGQWANGITSTGVTAQANRTIAVDPNVIPYGTKVLIDGKEYVAEDCGGAIKGNRIDIYFDTHQEALQWGVKYKGVIVSGTNDTEF